MKQHYTIRIISAARVFRMLRYRSRYIMLALCIMFVFVQEITVQATCIPPAVGVPFAPGPPKWWDSTVPGSAAIYNRIDDPRWKTASSITHGSGAIEQLSFRALHHTDATGQSIYLSWWVKVAPVAPATQNILYVGLRPSGGGTNTLVKVRLTSNSAKCTSDYDIGVYAVDAFGDFGTPINPDPAWTDKIRIWANDPVSNTWAIHVNVPIDADLGKGTILGTDFSMWYQILQGTPSTPVVSYTWPREPGFSVTTAAFVEKVPQPSTWPSFHLSTGPSDPICATGGITIEALDIGTNHPSGSGYISKTNPNTFFAKPTNKTGGPIDVGNVHARFRLANWGTQSDPNDVPNPDDLWKEIRGLGDVTQPAPPATIADNSKWNITGTWQLNAAEQAEFNGVNRWDHQCMLVELSGPGLIFLRSSIHRNMNFVPASKYTENAQVSVVGIPSIPGGGSKRDVYLYIQALNMPAVVDSATKNKYKEAAKEKQTIINHTELVGMPNSPPDVDERPVVEQIAEKSPTYIIHGYYDTGETIHINGVNRPVLRPLTSFGYFIEHEGDIAGWEYGLNGAGLIRIAPNFYKIATPNDGTTKITAIIEAIEPIRFAIIAHGGVNIPHGDFNDDFDPGLSLNLGFEYAITNWLSAVAATGYHTFADGGFGSKLNIYQEVAIHARLYPVNTRIRPFINVGSGLYKLDPGDTKPGFVGGIGLQLGLSSRLSLEAAYGYHQVNGDKIKPNFSTIQGGIRIGL